MTNTQATIKDQVLARLELAWGPSIANQFRDVQRAQNKLVQMLDDLSAVLHSEFESQTGHELMIEKRGSKFGIVWLDDKNKKWFLSSPGALLPFVGDGRGMTKLFGRQLTEKEFQELLELVSLEYDHDADNSNPRPTS